MRIVFLQCFFPPQLFGGAATSTFEFAKGMKEAGHEVFVITTVRSKDDAGESIYEGITVFKIASDYQTKWRWYVSLYNRSVLKELKKLFERIKPDIIHANNIHFYISYYALKLAKQYAKIVIFTARDVMTFNFAKLTTSRYLKNFDARTTWIDHIKQAKKRWNPFRNFIIRRCLKYTDKIYAVSFALKKALEQNGIANVSVLHTGITNENWQVNDEEVGIFQDKYNLHNKKIILFGGRLSAAKGGKQILEALVHIVRETPDVILLVAANVDEYGTMIKKWAHNLHVEKNVIFTGWLGRQEIKCAYAVSNVVVAPSICFDSLPRIVLEAMASGKPVVGTCYGGAPELIEEGKTGYVVNPFHIKEMAEKILILLQNPETAESFGKAGYKRVKTHFNLDDKIHDTILSYEKLLK